MNRSTVKINDMFNFKVSTNARPEYCFKIETINTVKRKTTNFLDKGRDLYNELPIKLRDMSFNEARYKKALKEYISDNFLLTKH